jgi:hypothetical protein
LVGLDGEFVKDGSASTDVRICFRIKRLHFEEKTFVLRIMEEHVNVFRNLVY